MKGLRNLLSKEQSRLEEIIKETKNRLEKAPSGTLRISKSHNHVQYYRRTDDKKTGDYIPKDNNALAQQLGQKSYDERVMQLAKKRYTQIKKIVKDYEDDELENIYLREHFERQKLIKPIEPTWEQRMHEWISKEYAGKELQEDIPVILTEKGERVERTVVIDTQADLRGRR